MNASPTIKRDARSKILDAALHLIRAQGFAATSVDDLCKQAGVTKGAFFHHFKSKDELGVAAANYWSEVTSALFRSAPYHAPKDPLARILAYLDFRKGLIVGDLPDFTCLVGTMVQETYDSAPAIRDACYASISGHAQTLEADIEACIHKYAANSELNAPSLALHTQAVIQGAFILAKASGRSQLAADSIDHLRRYFELLFAKPRTAPAAVKQERARRVKRSH
ncbi:MAG: TetR/AcrR family transcriptional regulator [Caulobacterales bacterium]